MGNSSTKQLRSSPGQTYLTDGSVSQPTLLSPMVSATGQQQFSSEMRVLTDSDKQIPVVVHSSENFPLKSILRSGGEQRSREPSIGSGSRSVMFEDSTHDTWRGGGSRQHQNRFVVPGPEPPYHSQSSTAGPPVLTFSLEDSTPIHIPRLQYVHAPPSAPQTPRTYMVHGPPLASQQPSTPYSMAMFQPRPSSLTGSMASSSSSVGDSESISSVTSLPVRYPTEIIPAEPQRHRHKHNHRHRKQRAPKAPQALLSIIPEDESRSASRLQLSGQPTSNGNGHFISSRSNQHVFQNVPSSRDTPMRAFPLTERGVADGDSLTSESEFRIYSSGNHVHVNRSDSWASDSSKPTLLREIYFGGKNAAAPGHYLLSPRYEPNAKTINSPRASETDSHSATLRRSQQTFGSVQRLHPEPTGNHVNPSGNLNGTGEITVRRFNSRPNLANSSGPLSPRTESVIPASRWDNTPQKTTYF